MTKMFPIPPYLETNATHLKRPSNLLSLWD